MGWFIFGLGVVLGAVGYWAVDKYVAPRITLDLD